MPLSLYLLQWGRGRSAAESEMCWVDATRPEPASMGPRPISRGEDELRLRYDPDYRASMGPRPISRGETCSQARREEDLCASMGPRPISRGEFFCGKLYTEYQIASMGPRPISRGEPAHRRAGDVVELGFNGAAADQPRRAG